MCRARITSTATAGRCFTNRLALETSPYLLQHAHNPVNWFPWGDEAFAEARRLGKARLPVDRLFDLSLVPRDGGRVLRGRGDRPLPQPRYVAIKVDREERPDVDAVYMSAVLSTDRRRRLADERLADRGARALLSRHLLPAARRRPRRPARLPVAARRLVRHFQRDPDRVGRRRRRWWRRFARTCRARTERRGRRRANGLPASDVIDATVAH
jgi:hypothetical protein